MEKDRFDQLVAELLVPALKSHVARHARYSSADAVRQERSIRLVPRGQPHPCADCEDVIETRSIDFYYRAPPNGIPYWEKKCGECGIKTKIKLREKLSKKPLD